jgi:hypothetical protein
MRFTGSGLNGQGTNGQRIVGAVHTTLRRGFFILLNGHI